MKNRISKLLLLAAFFSFASANAAEPNANTVVLEKLAEDTENTFTMDGGQVIEIKRYIAGRDLFELENVEYYGQGPLFTTPEEISRCIAAVDAKKISRRPQSFVGKIFKTDLDIVLMTPEFAAKRKKKR